jgi:hypothetical protein
MCQDCYGNAMDDGADGMTALADIERLALELFDKDTDYDWSKVHQSLRDHYMHRAARLLDRSKQINDEIDAIEAALSKADLDEN